MKILYFDCFAGISGDMTLGALLDLGIDKDEFLNELNKLNVTGYGIEFSRVKKNGIEGTDVNVILEEEHHHKHDAVEEKHEQGHHHEHEHHQQHHHEEKHHHGHRNLYDIEKIIDESTLDEKVKSLSKEIFMKVAKAEAKIHGTTLENIHFHEVGALDSIIDIIGAAICIHKLNPDKIISSPLHVGRGLVKCQHGIIPVPAPATMEIIREGKVPVYSLEVNSELVTPTGAAIISAIAEDFQPMPEMSIEKIGYGTGKRNMEVANLLRVVMGTTKKKTSGDEVIVIETNIDDMTGEIAGYVMEKLLTAGALDVFYTPIQMKKNRPGIKLSVLAKPNQLEKLQKIIFLETTTIGIRMYKAERRIMDREILVVNIPYGKVRVKAVYQDDMQKYAPEYEDCKKIAEAKNIPLKEVYADVYARIHKG